MQSNSKGSVTVRTIRLSDFFTRTQPSRRSRPQTGTPLCLGRAFRNCQNALTFLYDLFELISEMSYADRAIIHK